MVFSVSIFRDSKKNGERYKTLYVEAPTFGEAEERVQMEIKEDKSLSGYEITTISKESDADFLVS